MRVHHQPDNVILSDIVKDEVLRDAALVWTGRSETAPLRFAPRFDPADPKVATMLRLLRTAVEELDRAGSLLQHPAAVASAEQSC